MKNFLLILAAGLVLSACNDKDYKLKSDKTYEKSKETMEEKEKRNPATFLTVQGKDKKNILGQTVVKGTVYNNAKVVTFKDVDVKLSFYSKTGALLEEDHETVYETVPPGGSKSFKSKYFTPKGTDSIAMKVITAKF